MAPPPQGTHLSPDPAAEPLTARGRRVRVAPVTKADLVPYRHAVAASRDRLAVWNPVDPGDLERHLRFQSSGHRTFIVHALEPLAEHDIVGRVNVTNVVRGRALAASMGYDAYDPYAGRGLFAEGLRLVVDLILAPEPRGMGLHRVEASVQPGNTRSAGLMRSLGFVRRGAWPGYQWLPDGSGSHAWRDHVTYGVTAAEWPTRPYAAPVRTPAVVVLPTASTAGGTRTAGGQATPGWGAVGPELARELGVPFVPAAALGALGAAAAIELLRTCPGVVLEAGAITDVVLSDLGWGETALLLDHAGPGDAVTGDAGPGDAVTGDAGPGDAGWDTGAGWDTPAGVVSIALQALARAHERGAGQVPSR